jgi:isocitrate dehydrogenase
MNQSEDAQLAVQFKSLFEQLSEQEAVILEELASVQGKPVDIGGYYFADPELCKKIMRPSETFNTILKAASQA